MATSATLFNCVVCWLLAVLSSIASDDVAPLATPSGLSFLGIGYNVLTGNPDGGDVTTGGVDPGLLVTRRVLDLTYDNNELSLDGQYQVPDQVTFVPRDSCIQVSNNQVFHGTRSYQGKLTRDIDLDADLDVIFAGVEFSKSSRYQEIRDATFSSSFVFYEDRTICNRGEARYKDELAEVDRYPLSRSFVVDACALPTNFSMTEYMGFLDDWGTGVVIEVDVGVKTIDRFRSSDIDFVKYVTKEHEDTLQLGGSFLGHSSSVIVDMEAFSSEMTSSDFFGEYSETLNIGSDDLPEPISVKIIGIHEIFAKNFWQMFDDYVTEGLCDVSFMTQMSDLRSNVLLALENFATWKNAQPSDDPPVQVPLTWPYGTYTLPMPQAGCPITHFYWNTGSRYQDTGKYIPYNDWSEPCHLQGPYNIFSVEQNFCSKMVEAMDDYNWEWPEGEYCILKKGNECPTGFDEGWVLWDDNDRLNSNRITGEVPEGVYDRDTLMYFCCRDDGLAARPVLLPTDDNFFLYMKSPRCQEVSGMAVSEEWLQWDAENDRLVPEEYEGGSTPYNTGSDSDHKIHYCYYYTGDMD